MNLLPYILEIQLLFKMSMPKGVQLRLQKRPNFVCLWLFIVCLKLRFKDTTCFWNTQIIEYKYSAVSARCKLYLYIYLHLALKEFYCPLCFFLKSVGLQSLYFLNSLFKWLSSVNPSSSTISLILISLCKSRLSTIFIL